MPKRKRRGRSGKFDWEALITSCLHNSKHTNKWGCLNSKGELFRIATFKKVQVPASVITRMKEHGLIALDKSRGSQGFYKYVI